MYDIRQLNRKRVHRLTQLLKAKILATLPPQERERIKTQLLSLDEKYTKDQISLDDYKFLSLSILTKYWSASRVEQFLYRHAGNFLTQAEKFTLAELSPQKLQD